MYQLSRIIQKKAVHQISSPKDSGLSTTILPLNSPHGSLNALSVWAWDFSSMVLLVVTIVLYSVVYHYRITDVVAVDFFWLD